MELDELNVVCLEVDLFSGVDKGNVSIFEHMLRKKCILQTMSGHERANVSCRLCILYPVDYEKLEYKVQKRESIRSGNIYL